MPSSYTKFNFSALPTNFPSFIMTNISLNSSSIVASSINLYGSNSSLNLYTLFPFNFNKNSFFIAGSSGFPVSPPGSNPPPSPQPIPPEFKALDFIWLFSLLKSSDDFSKTIGYSLSFDIWISFLLSFLSLSVSRVDIISINPDISSYLFKYSISKSSIISSELQVKLPHFSLSDSIIPSSNTLSLSMFFKSWFKGILIWGLAKNSFVSLIFQSIPM